MDEYINALKAHDWLYDFSDDHSVWAKGHAQYLRLQAMREAMDPTGTVWKQYQRLP